MTGNRARLRGVWSNAGSSLALSTVEQWTENPRAVSSGGHNILMISSPG